MAEPSSRDYGHLLRSSHHYLPRKSRCRARTVATSSERDGAGSYTLAASGVKLSLALQEQMYDLATQMMRQSVEEYQRFRAVNTQEDAIDLNRWKLHKQKENIAVFRRRSKEIPINARERRNSRRQKHHADQTPPASPTSLTPPSCSVSRTYEDRSLFPEKEMTVGGVQQQTLYASQQPCGSKAFCNMNLFASNPTLLAQCAQCPLQVLHREQFASSEDAHGWEDPCGCCCACSSPSTPTTSTQPSTTKGCNPTSHLSTPLPTIVYARGEIQGTLQDVMLGMTSFTTQEMRQNSFYLQQLDKKSNSKRHGQDCSGSGSSDPSSASPASCSSSNVATPLGAFAMDHTVLATIEPPKPNKPFNFIGIKRFVFDRKAYGSTGGVVKNSWSHIIRLKKKRLLRQFVCLEATGIVKLKAKHLKSKQYDPQRHHQHGHEEEDESIGFVLVKSIDLPGMIAHEDSNLYGNLAFCLFFREVSPSVVSFHSIGHCGSVAVTSSGSAPLSAAHNSMTTKQMLKQDESSVQLLTNLFFQAQSFASIAFKKKLSWRLMQKFDSNSFLSTRNGRLWREASFMNMLQSSLQADQPHRHHDPNTVDRTTPSGDSAVPDDQWCHVCHHRFRRSSSRSGRRQATTPSKRKTNKKKYGFFAVFRARQLQSQQEDFKVCVLCDRATCKTCFETMRLAFPVPSSNEIVSHRVGLCAICMEHIHSQNGQTIASLICERKQHQKLQHQRRHHQVSRTSIGGCSTFSKTKRVISSRATVTSRVSMMESASVARHRTVSVPSCNIAPASIPAAAAREATVHAQAVRASMVVTPARVTKPSTKQTHVSVIDQVPTQAPSSAAVSSMSTVTKESSSVAPMTSIPLTRTRTISVPCSTTCPRSPTPAYPKERHSWDSFHSKASPPRGIKLYCPTPTKLGDKGRGRQCNGHPNQEDDEGDQPQNHTEGDDDNDSVLVLSRREFIATAHRSFNDNDDPLQRDNQHKQDSRVHPQVDEHVSSDERMNKLLSRMAELTQRARNTHRMVQQQAKYQEQQAHQRAHSHSVYY